MFTIDRTTKLLLTVIVIFLAALVFRPFFQVTPIVWAQTTAGSGDSGTAQSPSGLVGYRTSLISSIGVTDRIRSVQVINSAQAFIVQYDTKLEVYRVNDLTKETLTQLRQNIQ